MKAQGFRYWIMSFMPDITRGESVNIGAILYFPDIGFKGGKFLTPEEIQRKCYQVIGDYELKTLVIYIKGIQKGLNNPSEDFSDLEAKWLKSNAKIQFTEPKGGLSRNPQKKLDWLFNTYVALPLVCSSTCR